MCSFNIPFAGSATGIISKVRTGIQQAGGNFNEISPAEGNFSISSPLGSIQGSYSIAGSSIGINITQKPAFISCSRIEKELKDRLGSTD